MSVGQPYELFWELTLAEVSLVLDGETERLRREHNDRAWHAWHVAALGRAKKLPRLDTLLAKPQTTPRRQTWEEQMAVMQAWSERVNRRAAKQDQNIIG